MSRAKKKPTKEEEALKALCLIGIHNQTTIQEVCSELLRQHELIKTYIKEKAEEGK